MIVFVTGTDSVERDKDTDAVRVELVVRGTERTKRLRRYFHLPVKNKVKIYLYLTNDVDEQDDKLLLLKLVLQYANKNVHYHLYHHEKNTL